MGSAAAAQHESIVLACGCSPCRAEALWTAEQESEASCMRTLAGDCTSVPYRDRWHAQLATSTALLFL